MPGFSKSQQLHKKEKALDFTHEGQASTPKRAPRKPMKKVSDKQAKELVKRAKLRKELIEESGGLCMKCGKLPDFRGLSIHHIKKLSGGGVTRLDNLLLLCYNCHSKEHHLIEV